MNARDFVALAIMAADGHVQGKTKLQKLVYFVGTLTNSLEELGYRPHFYGPYSDDVAYAITQLRAIGAIDQKVSDWGTDSSGFEIRRYDFCLNNDGKQYAARLSERSPAKWDEIRKAVEAYKVAGDIDYMQLSIAAKTHFLLKQNLAPASSEELAKFAEKFGWQVTPDEVSQAIQYLQRLSLC